MGRAATEIVDVQFRPESQINEAGFCFLVGRNLPAKMSMAKNDWDKLILVFAWAAIG